MNVTSVDLLVCLTVHYLYSMQALCISCHMAMRALANVSQGAKRPRAINYVSSEPLYSLAI